MDIRDIMDKDFFYVKWYLLWILWIIHNKIKHFFLDTKHKKEIDLFLYSYWENF